MMAHEIHPSITPGRSRHRDRNVNLTLACYLHLITRNEMTGVHKYQARIEAQVNDYHFLNDAKRLNQITCC